MMTTSPVSRRTILKSAPAGIAALAVLSATTIHPLAGTTLVDLPDAPITAAFAKWSAAYETMADNEDQALDAQLFEELRACERACVKLTPMTARGLAMQFLVFTAFGEFEATKSADHDFEATMLRIAGVAPPRGLAESASVRDILGRLTTLPAVTAPGLAQ